MSRWQAIGVNTVHFVSTACEIPFDFSPYSFAFPGGDVRREVGAASVCVTVVSDDGNITVCLGSSSDQVSGPVVLNKDVFNPVHNAAG